ncbi:MAG: proline--tRNA ligase [Candidatus Omnitrophica bacterium]|nr:proline--tRNA ligase [Candidatus Omnitrophota bacterium]
MRWTQTHIPTLRQTPAEAEIASHRLMLRAGFIRKLSAGTYSYLPLGHRSLLKVIQIIREEMNRTGALEVLMPAIQPAELWRKSGRYNIMGPELIRFKDRHGKDVVLGPTHEEIITSLVAGELRSYRDLPKNLYQIQTKFRDEPRPRFGVIRSSEFIMKDAYSFHRDAASLDAAYRVMYDTYKRIFDRCGLQTIPVEAETGMIGGKGSHEFMVLAATGEDTVVTCSGCSYAASKGRAAVGPLNGSPAASSGEKPKVVDTPGVSSVEKVSAFLKVQPARLIKTILFLADGKPVAALVRGDHEVNELKVKEAVSASEIRLADPQVIEQTTGAPVGFSGPIGLKNVKIIADHVVMTTGGAVVGANQPDRHIINVTPGRDFTADQVADIRYPQEGDICPKCAKPLQLLPAIEVGHVFKLGTKYSEPMGATFLDEDGKEKPFIMGCYGIGVTRILAAVAETHNDRAGLQWPVSIAPYTVDIIPINMAYQSAVKAAGDLYEQAMRAGLEAILDDREVSGGVKLKDADLIGFPYRIVLSEKTLQQSSAEVKRRPESQASLIQLDKLIPVLQKEIAAASQKAS